VQKVKRSIAVVLRDHNYLAGQRMGDSRFVEDVLISPCAVTQDNARPINQCNHTLNDRGILPNVIRALAFETHLLACLSYSVINRIVFGIERHHRRREGQFNLLLLGQMENRWPVAAGYRVAVQKSEKTYVLHCPMVSRKFKIMAHVEPTRFS
jgi:hypothetical protein